MATRILTTNTLTPQQLTRFWAKVEVRGSEDCWPWQATKIPDGYGSFGLSHCVGMVLAHRVAFFIHHGWWPETVRHTCDNPPCCNVAHLLAGTQIDNIKDRDDRERRILKLKRGDTDTIRYRVATGELQRIVASTYGISQSTVSDIVNRRRWYAKH